MLLRPFFTLSSGKSAADAYKSAVKDARRCFGPGRTGTIADTTQFDMGPPLPPGVDPVLLADLFLSSQPVDAGAAVCWDLGPVPDDTGRHAYIFAGLAPVSLYDSSLASISADPEWMALLGRSGKAKRSRALPAPKAALSARSAI